MHFLKIMKLRHVSESPQIPGNRTLKLILYEKSVRNACRRMQTVLGNSFRFQAFFSKNYQFLETLNFYQKMVYDLGQDISCIKFPVVCDIEALFK